MFIIATALKSLLARLGQWVSDFYLQASMKSIWSRGCQWISMEQNKSGLVCHLQVPGYAKISRSHYWRRFGSVISRFINRLQQGQLMWPQWHWNNKIIHIFKLKLPFSNAVKCVTSFGLCDHVICISIRVSLSFHVRVLSILASQLFNIVTYPSWWIAKSLKGLNCRKIWKDAKWQNQFLCSVISNNTC